MFRSIFRDNFLTHNYIYICTRTSSKVKLRHPKTSCVNYYLDGCVYIHIYIYCFPWFPNLSASLYVYIHTDKHRYRDDANPQYGHPINHININIKFRQIHRSIIFVDKSIINVGNSQCHLSTIPQENQHGKVGGMFIPFSGHGWFMAWFYLH